MTNTTPFASSPPIVTISKGALFNGVGMAVGLGASFLARVLMARHGMAAEYGVFALALAALSLIGTFATLGLSTGATRLVAHHSASEHNDEVRASVSGALALAATAAVTLSVVAYYTAGTIAIGLYHESQLLQPLRWMAFGLPAFVLLQVLSGIFMGFADAKPRVFFNDIMVSVVFLVVLAVALSAETPFDYVFPGYVGALNGSAVALAFYTGAKLPMRPLPLRSPIVRATLRPLLTFSLPLLVTGVVQVAMGWMDTLMLGYFADAQVVGLYNAALPLAHFVHAPTTAFVLIYMPVTAALHAKSQLQTIQHNFVLMTRWVFAATIPMCILLAFRSTTTLSQVFGGDYSAAASALQVLAIGFMCNNLMGFSSATLIAMGQSRWMMWTTLTTAILNVLLNAVLIPLMGMLGAAIATALSLAAGNMMRLMMLQARVRLCPVDKKTVTLVLGYTALVGTIAFFIPDSWPNTLGTTLLALGLLYGLLALMIHALGLDEAERAMLVRLAARRKTR